MGNPQINVNEGETEQQKAYTCPMHPEILSDKPGNCPKCGMKLVPKKMEGNESHGEMNMNKQAQENVPMLPEKIIGGGKVVKYHLYVKDTIVTYGGKSKRAIAVNGQIPMPTLTFTEGDNFTRKSSVATTPFHAQAVMISRVLLLTIMPKP